MRRNLLSVGVLMVLTAGQGEPAHAQSARKGPAFYVVLNSLTKGCAVVDKTPRTDTPNITVASDSIYKSRAEAEAAMKDLPSCKR